MIRMMFLRCWNNLHWLKRHSIVEIVVRTLFTFCVFRVSIWLNFNTFHQIKRLNIYCRQIKVRNAKIDQISEENLIKPLKF